MSKKRNKNGRKSIAKKRVAADRNRMRDLELYREIEEYNDSGWASEDYLSNSYSSDVLTVSDEYGNELDFTSTRGSIIESAIRDPEERYNPSIENSDLLSRMLDSAEIKNIDFTRVIILSSEDPSEPETGIFTFKKDLEFRKDKGEFLITNPFYYDWLSELIVSGSLTSVICIHESNEIGESGNPIEFVNGWLIDRPGHLRGLSSQEMIEFYSIDNSTGEKLDLESDKFYSSSDDITFW